MVSQACLLESQDAKESPDELRGDPPPTDDGHARAPVGQERHCRRPKAMRQKSLGGSKAAKPAKPVGDNDGLASQPRPARESEKWVANVTKNGAVDGDVDGADLVGDRIDVAMDHAGSG